MAKRTVKDFPPEFMLCWQQALQGKLALRLPTSGKATNLRHQLYTFRKRLNEEAPEAAAPFFEVDLILEGCNIRSGLADWKRQVRAGLAHDPEAGPEIGAALAQAVDATAELVIAGDPIVSAPDAMSEKLSNLGFTLEEPKEG